MNLLAGGGFAVLTAGLLYVFVEQKPADVYDIPMPQVYEKLASTDLGQSEASDSIELKTSVTGNGNNQLQWSRSTSHSRRKCTLQLAPFEGDADRTHITITCTGRAAGDGAASGITHNMARNAMIERIDALLTDREFDEGRAAATASRWPGDGVDGSIGAAAGKALQMDRDMQKMQQEIRR